MVYDQQPELSALLYRMELQNVFYVNITFFISFWVFLET